jgi:hypothetical protein
LEMDFAVGRSPCAALMSCCICGSSKLSHCKHPLQKQVCHVADAVNSLLRSRDWDVLLSWLFACSSNCKHACVVVLGCCNSGSANCSCISAMAQATWPAAC